MDENQQIEELVKILGCLKGVTKKRKLIQISNDNTSSFQTPSLILESKENFHYEPENGSAYKKHKA
jgi:hypothetical protein